MWTEVFGLVSRRQTKRRREIRSSLLVMICKDLFQYRQVPRVCDSKRAQEPSELVSQELRPSVIPNLDVDAKRSKRLLAVPARVVDLLNNLLNIVPIRSISIGVGFEAVLNRALAVHDLCAKLLHPIFRSKASVLVALEFRLDRRLLIPDSLQGLLCRCGIGARGCQLALGFLALGFGVFLEPLRFLVNGRIVFGNLVVQRFLLSADSFELVLSHGISPDRGIKFIEHTFNVDTSALLALISVDSLFLFS